MREAGREPCWSLLPVPLAWGAAGGRKRSRSRRLGWEEEGWEQAVTIRTGRARSLSLRRSGFLLSQCFLTHFLSSQSDIYLTLQLRCTGNAKFRGCRRSPCCRVYTWKLTRSTHTHVWAHLALGHAHACARGTQRCHRPVPRGLSHSAGPGPAVTLYVLQTCPCQPRVMEETSLCTWCPWTQILAEPSGALCV